MTAQPSEADVIFNRANVALARSQRLVASWLPPPTDSELKNAKTEERIKKEEQEMFTPVPEVYVRDEILKLRAQALVNHSLLTIDQAWARSKAT